MESGKGSGKRGTGKRERRVGLRGRKGKGAVEGSEEKGKRKRGDWGRGTGKSKKRVERLEEGEGRGRTHSSRGGKGRVKEGHVTTALHTTRRHY